MIYRFFAKWLPFAILDSYDAIGTTHGENGARERRFYYKPLIESDYMAHRIVEIPVIFSDFKVISLLQTLSNGIFRTRSSCQDFTK